MTPDATNTFGVHPAGFESLAQQVQSIVGGPTAKAFNTNFAALYDRIDAEPFRQARSSPRIRKPVRGYRAADPRRRIRPGDFLGDLSQAALLENMIGITMGVARSGLGPFFYRFSRPPSMAEAAGPVEAARCPARRSRSGPPGGTGTRRRARSRGPSSRGPVFSAKRA